MAVHEQAERALEMGGGVLRLAPAWVPRYFCVPGRRIKLHPDDYYALGTEYGGIDERWFSSATQADNGERTRPGEGLSRIVVEDGGSTEFLLLRDAVAELKSDLIGQRLWERYGKWPIYSKFFDNMGPLPHHIHHQDRHAELVGAAGKPEAYYFPPQLNNHGGEFPYTFFGFNPGTTREEVKQSLIDFTKGDNRITDLSRCYRLKPGTGWDVPPGVLHAPGSLCTYEPQTASDVYAMFQSLAGTQLIEPDALWKDTPEEKRGDFDHLIDLIDWPLNVDPDFHQHRFMQPVPVRDGNEMNAEGYDESWICFKSKAFSAKELTVFPGRSVVIKDAAAYGFIMVQGHGTLTTGKSTQKTGREWPIETPALIRFEQLTHDEFFVGEQAASEGVTITNPSGSDPIVMLKHFGPENPDLNG